ncbi:MAG: PEP-CTERM sorting domain-containing protein [Planctomycetota bacterium]|jgi:hypothetical protein
MKKNVLKVVLIAVACFASTGLASTVITWTNGDPGDSSYNTPGNWDTGVVPNVWWDTEVVINGGGAVVHESGFNQNLAAWVGFTGPGQLDVTGGDLVAGYNADAGGGYPQAGWLAIGHTADGVVNVDGGNLWANNDMHVGSLGGANGELNITSGNVWAKTLQVGNLGGNGQINISGGALQLMHRADAYNTASAVAIGALGNIDLTAGGEIFHWGDATAGFAWLSDPINGNLLTAYGGAGTVNYEYVAESDYTRVWAVPEPTTMMLLGLGGLLIRRKR